MEYINYIIPALLVAWLVVRILPTKGVRQITTAELRKELKDKSKIYVDVRTPGEFSSNHIKGFKNIPLQILAQNTKELSKEKEIVVICQSGMRSNKACKVLKKHGFDKVTNVKGGMSAWV
ncbi:rhodanese-like domain-containing protein [Bacillaceae bacterium S4-13-58]